MTSAIKAFETTPAAVLLQHLQISTVTASSTNAVVQQTAAPENTLPAGHEEIVSTADAIASGAAFAYFKKLPLEYVNLAFLLSIFGLVSPERNYFIPVPFYSLLPNTC